MPYCQHCGTKLEDGQICTCEMAQSAASQQPQPAQAPLQQPAAPATPPAESQVSIIFRKFKLYLSSYISNPTQAVRSVMAEEYDFTIPIVLTVIRLLAMGLAIYGYLNKVCKEILTLITTTILRYGSTADILTAKLTASLPKSLFFGALIAAIGMLLFAAMLYALVKIQHGEATFGDIFKASAANGVPTSALLLLAFLCSFFSVTPCVVFIALAMLSWIISGVRTARLVAPNSDSGSFGMMYFVGVVLIIVVGYWVIPTIFLWAVGGITASYMGETATLQSAFDEIKKLMAEEGISGFKELYEKSLEQFYTNFITEFWRTMY